MSSPPCTLQGKGVLFIFCDSQRDEHVGSFALKCADGGGMEPIDMMDQEARVGGNGTMCAATAFFRKLAQG
jgi:hypothetical protein